jgi:D-alanyl-D-alanine carboxypeptidase
VPNGDAITVEMLLNHTNGLFSVNEDRKVRRRKTELTFDESLAVMRKHGAMFCPGERWRYTNSGYGLLGHILEVIEGRPFDQVITASVLDPLDLPNIRVLGNGDTAQDVATLYSSDPKVDPMRPGSAGAAGPMVASSEAVVRMWHAVLNSKVIRPETLSLMFQRLYPMFSDTTYYGLGVMAYEIPQADGTTRLWIGHSGGAPGVQAVFAYSPSDHAFVAVALSGDGSAEAVAYSLLGALAD